MDNTEPQDPGEKQTVSSANTRDLATEPRQVTVKDVSPEAHTEAKVMQHDLEFIARELRTVKRLRRWRGLLASILAGIAIAAIFAGIAGIHKAEAPIPLRVAYFTAGIAFIVFSIILFIVDKEDLEDPLKICTKVLRHMEENSLCSKIPNEPLPPPLLRRFGRWFRRTIW